MYKKLLIILLTLVLTACSNTSKKDFFSVAAEVLNSKNVSFEFNAIKRDATDNIYARVSATGKVAKSGDAYITSKTTITTDNLQTVEPLNLEAYIVNGKTYINSSKAVASLGNIAYENADALVPLINKSEGVLWSVIDHSLIDINEYRNKLLTTLTDLREYPTGIEDKGAYYILFEDKQAYCTISNYYNRYSISISYTKDDVTTTAVLDIHVKTNDISITEPAGATPMPDIKDCKLPLTNLKEMLLNELL